MAAAKKTTTPKRRETRADMRDNVGKITGQQKHCKYIRTKTGFYIFPEGMPHQKFAMALFGSNLDRVLSAGYVNPAMECYGHSESLDSKSAAVDTDDLQKQLLTGSV